MVPRFSLGCIRNHCGVYVLLEPKKPVSLKNLRGFRWGSREIRFFLRVVFFFWSPCKTWFFLIGCVFLESKKKHFFSHPCPAPNDMFELMHLGRRARNKLGYFRREAPFLEYFFGAKRRKFSGYVPARSAGTFIQGIFRRGAPEIFRVFHRREAPIFF